MTWKSKVGDRVIRGPDWSWGKQDTDDSGTQSEGTVAKVEDYSVSVRWDYGHYNSYMHKEHDKIPQDLKLAPWKPKVGNRVIYNGGSSGFRGMEGAILECTTYGNFTIKWADGSNSTETKEDLKQEDSDMDVKISSEVIRGLNLPYKTEDRYSKRVKKLSVRKVDVLRKWGRETSIPSLSGRDALKLTKNQLIEALASGVSPDGKDVPMPDGRGDGSGGEGEEQDDGYIEIDGYGDEEEDEGDGDDSSEEEGEGEEKEREMPSSYFKGQIVVADEHRCRFSAHSTSLYVKGELYVVSEGTSVEGCQNRLGSGMFSVTSGKHVENGNPHRNTMFNCQASPVADTEAVLSDIRKGLKK